MRHLRLSVAALLMAVSAGAHAGGQAPEVFELSLHDTVQPVSAAALERAIERCERHGGTAVLVNLSTPGGLAESAEAMVRSIEDSPVPVIVFTAPSNMRVSGEGLRLLAAADVAVMAPGTYLTPLSPDQARGRMARTQAEEARSLLAALFMLSHERGRSPSLGIKLVTGDAWVPADWAKSDGFVDMVAADEAALLEGLEGRVVRRLGGRAGRREVRLYLSHATITPVEPTVRERLMRALVNPDLAVLLLALGGLLIYLEFNTPGTILPGAAGLLLMLLAIYALHLLPLRGSSLLLLVGSGVLLLGETRSPRRGVLAAAGVCLLPIGLATLVAGPIRELEVGWATAIGVGLGFGGITALLILLGMRARQLKRLTGAEAMLGWLAVAETALAPEGRVLVRGELWKARMTGSEAAVDAGARVRVLRANGPVLEVTAIAQAQEA